MRPPGVSARSSSPEEAVLTVLGKLCTGEIQVDAKPRSALRQKLQQLQQSFQSQISGIFGPFRGGSSAAAGAVSPLRVAFARTYDAEITEDTEPPVSTDTVWLTGRRLLQKRGAPFYAQQYDVLPDTKPMAGSRLHILIELMSVSSLREIIATLRKFRPLLLLQ